MPKTRRVDITLCCINEECEMFDEEIPSTLVCEGSTGACYISPESDEDCDSCGEEREQI